MKRWIKAIGAATFVLLVSFFLLWHFHILSIDNSPVKEGDTPLAEGNSATSKPGNTDIADSTDVFDNSQNPLTDGIQKTDITTETDITKEPETTTAPDITAKAEEQAQSQSETQAVTEGQPNVERLTNTEMGPIRGIYVSGFKAGISNYMSEFISLTENSEVNGMVIDVKNDSGEITYKMDLPLVKEIGAGTGYIKDMPGLVKELKEKNIYLIARIVAFKDPLLAKERKDLSLKKQDGTIFKDKNGDCWVNPYKKEVWDYLVDIGKEAAALGFDEIQFDYIRFSTDAGMRQVNFGTEAKSKTKTETITEFTKYACESLKPLGVKVSADVFGTIIGSKMDAEIVGQNYSKMAEYYICPMIYPSHYGEGSFGIAYPDTKPYETILAALKKSREVLKAEEKESGKKVAVVRPWLQDFTATWVKHHIHYGTEEIKEQIKAVYDAGYSEWILWNGSNNYTKTAFEKK